MSEARHKALLRKAVSACVAAIEIYNKPVMPHRDETFANNQLRAIQVLVPIIGRNGKPTKRMQVKRNRSGNEETISLGEAVHRVKQLPKQKLDPACEAGLWSLVEIRDNAVHFIIDETEMARRAHEACCACIRNFVAAVGEWFDHDLSEHRFMILPLSFDAVTGPALTVPSRRTRQAANLMAFLDRAGDEHPVQDKTSYAAAVKVETRIVGSRNPDAAAIKLCSGPDATKVTLTEEQIADRWPYDYTTFVKRIVARVPGIKQNKAFHKAVKALKSEERFVFRRRLDPRDPKCKSCKEFFNDAAVDAAVKVLKPVLLL